MRYLVHLPNLFSRAFGVLILYIAIFLYEDEEGRCQNWLEEMWIRVRYGRDAALSTAAAIFVFSAQAATRIFDKGFGDRLVSFRAAGVSLCFSSASVLLFISVVTKLRLNTTYTGSHLSLFWSAFCFTFFAISRAWMNSKWKSRLWGAILIYSVGSGLGTFAFEIFKYVGANSGNRFAIFLSVMLAVSFACDLGFLAFTRWLLRRVSKTTGLPQIVGLAFLNCIIALSIVAIPFELAVVFSDRNGLTLLALASAAVIPLNVIDLIACGIVFVILALFISHRLLWPIFERPLYATARYGLIKRKGLLWAVGLTLLVGPDNSKSIFIWVAEKLLALKG